MNFLLTSTDVNKDILNSLDEGSILIDLKVGNYSIIREENFSFKETETLICLWNGYLNDYRKKSDDLSSQLESVFNSISSDWPVKENISGSFSATMVNKQTNELILCNDPIGIYPLYYLLKGGEIFISNSIIWLSIVSNCPLDEVGIFQRSFGPEFSNIGSRTILKDCKRLLPGEWLKFSSERTKFEIKYDNSLYQNITHNKISNTLIEEYWEVLKKELNYCVGNKVNINLALSGGLDSRIILGGVPSSKVISSHTYGKETNYETKLASRLARIKNSFFKSYSEPNLNFPPFDVLKRYTAQTEAVYLCSWLEILENKDIKEREVFLLGDMTESLQGRNLKTNKGRHQNSEWKYHLTSVEYPFKSNQKSLFESWKTEIINKYLKWCKSSNLKKLNLTISIQDLKNGIQDDLREIFLRIESHDLEIFTLNDELFSWYTHARHPMGRQVLLCNHKFESYCPSMSIQLLRFTSNLHPNIRINSRFMKRLFSDIKDLKDLGKVPTSQIPLMPLNWPNIFRLPMWFIRSKMDDYLIKRMVKFRDSERTYRLFRSNNWAQVYQNPNLEKNMEDYFKNNHLGKTYVQGIKLQALQRRDLKQWPFANMNIMNAAALNTELDLIASYKKLHEL